jgi:hypothetical protein
VTHDIDQPDARQNVLSSSRRTRTVRVAMATIVALVALAASPQVSGAVAAPAERQDAPSADPVTATATPTEWADTRLSDPAPQAAVPTPAPGEAPGSITVRHPLVVVNSDGSGTISAEVRNTTATEAALMDVEVEQAGESLPVSSTVMWLPVIPGYPAIVGAASDAGGFALDAAPPAGTTVSLTFVLDDGTRLTEKAPVVARSSEHSLIYPKNGTQLAPR